MAFGAIGSISGSMAKAMTNITEHISADITGGKNVASSTTGAKQLFADIEKQIAADIAGGKKGTSTMESAKQIINDLRRLTMPLV